MQETEAGEVQEPIAPGDRLRVDALDLEVRAVPLDGVPGTIQPPRLVPPLEIDLRAMRDGRRIRATASIRPQGGERIVLNETSSLVFWGVGVCTWDGTTSRPVHFDYVIRAVRRDWDPKTWATYFTRLKGELAARGLPRDLVTHEAGRYWIALRPGLDRIVALDPAP